MLTKEDLQAIAAIMDEKINTAISSSEERTAIRIQESEERTKRELKAYIENTAEKQVKTIAEGHMDIRRDMKELHKLDKDVSDLKDRVFALELKAKQG